VNHQAERCNLLLIGQADHVPLQYFQALARAVREIAPDVEARALWDLPAKPGSALVSGQPAVTCSFVPLRNFRPWRGAVLQNRFLAKDEEYAALERVGVPVPRWALLSRESAPDLGAFGPYVVVKPARSGKGADVKIKRKGRVRWTMPRTDYARRLSGPAPSWVVQDFIYTGFYPVSFRVTTLFGEPMWGWKVAADPRRRALKHAYDFRDGEAGGGISIVSSGRNCSFELFEESECYALARRAHAALPDFPVLGVDMVRDAQTGKLYVVEVNSGGFTWHVCSAIGRKIQAEFGFDIEARFGVQRHAATVLAEMARQRAR
jgi:hypothetical protein